MDYFILLLLIHSILIILDLILFLSHLIINYLKKRHFQIPNSLKSMNIDLLIYHYLINYLFHFQLFIYYFKLILFIYHCLNFDFHWSFIFKIYLHHYFLYLAQEHFN
jgi:hypothetical protein